MTRQFDEKYSQVKLSTDKIKDNNLYIYETDSVLSILFAYHRSPNFNMKCVFV